jgi:hypothetical protein
LCIAIKISKTFLKTLPVSSLEMLEDVFEFASIPDKEVFQNAFKDFSSVAEVDLTDALDMHDCRTRVTSESFKAVVLEIAHKAII